MITAFVNSISSEWLKTKRSAAFWLVLVGGFFTPSLTLLGYLFNIERLSKPYFEPLFWENWLIDRWEPMAVIFLPMGIVLATSLINQLEYKNNAWKQVHTTPQSFSLIFVAKLSVVLFLMVQLFVLFNLGMYLSGAIPAWVFESVPYPKEAFPWHRMLSLSLTFFVAALPIVGLQYLLSLLFKNFMVSLGVGIALVIGGMLGMSWKYFYLIAYNYGTIQHGQISGKMQVPQVNIEYLALGYTAAFILLAYLLYVSKKEKG